MNLLKSLRGSGGRSASADITPGDPVHSPDQVAKRSSGKNKKRFGFRMGRHNGHRSSSTSLASVTSASGGTTSPPMSGASSSASRPPSRNGTNSGGVGLIPQWPETASLRSRSPMPTSVVMTKEDAHRMSLLQTEEEGDLFLQNGTNSGDSPAVSSRNGTAKDNSDDDDTSEAISEQLLSSQPQPDVKMRDKSVGGHPPPPNSFCPVCRLPFGAGRRRKLIDGACGHARCYDCTFRSVDGPCQVCQQKQEGRATVIYEDIEDHRLRRSHPQRPHSVAGSASANQHDSSPYSLRGSAKGGGGGRESGFQSYSSMSSSVVSLNGGVSLRGEDEAFVDPDRISQCSSSLGSSVSTIQQQQQPMYASSLFGDAANLPPMRRELKRMSLGPTRSDVARRKNGGTSGLSALTRNSFARRSSHLPSSSRAFGGMAAIREQNSTLEAADGRSLSAMSFSTQADSCHGHFQDSGFGADLFVGRRWLLREMLAHLDTDLPTNRGLVITGGPGTGKTAFLNQLVKGGGQYQSSDGLGVLSAHFCRSDDEPTCLTSHFVRSVAKQLAASPLVPAFREYLEENSTLKARLSDESHSYESAESLLQNVVIEPLKVLKSRGRISLQQRGYLLILVDGLCEAEFHRTDGSETIATFLERHYASFPHWVRFVVTIRSGMIDVVRGLPFQRFGLDDSGFDERISKDLKDYVMIRCRRSPSLRQNTTPTVWRHEQTPQSALADHLAASACRGSFLCAKVALDLLEGGHIVAKSSGFNAVPQSLAEAYTLRMNLLFPSQQSYGRVRALFSVCLAALRPPTLRQVYLCLLATGDECEWEDFLHTYSVVSNFLPVSDDGETVFFFHSSFREWLTGKRSCDANKFACDPRPGHAAIALYLARKASPNGLGPEETLDLAHHVLKAQVFRPGGSGEGSLSPRELQALWVSNASADLSAALSCPRNVLQPNVVVSKLLLFARASPDAQTAATSDGSEGMQTPLLSRHVAAGNTEMVSLLVDFDVDVSATDSKGVSPLMLAAEMGSVTSCREILRGGREGSNGALNQSSNEGSTALSFAARAGSEDVLKLLLEETWPSSEYNREVAVREATLAACKAGQAGALRVILSDRDASPNKPCLLSHAMPLLVAVTSGKAALVRALLAAGADLSLVDSPLHVAVEKGHYEMVALLLDSGCDPCAPNKKGRPPMALAAREGHVPIMEMLSSRSGVGIDDRDSDGVTSLSWACIKGKQRSAEFLLRRGADPSSKDDEGRTALHHAAFAGCSTAVSMLLEAGVDVEAADKNGIRPVDQAVSHGHRDSVVLFLKKGAKLGPTTWAMAKDKPTILLLLLNKLLEDGNALFRREKLTEAAYRYEYALKKLPAPPTEKDGKVAKPKTRVEEVFLRLRSHLLLNLSRAQRRLGNGAAAVARATQALELPQDCAGASEAMWTRAKARFESGGDRGELELALADLREAVRLTPQNLELHRFTCRVKERLIQLDKKNIEPIAQAEENKRQEGEGCSKDEGFKEEGLATQVQECC